MHDRDKTKEQLFTEVVELRVRVRELEKAEGGCRLAEQRVKEQAEFLHLVLESLPHPFYVIDASDYTIRLANSATHRGRFANQVTCYALTHKSKLPCASQEHPCPLEIVKETRRPVTVEHLHYDEEGKSRNVEVHAYPIVDSEGNVSEVIESCLDITERKKAEEALRRTNEELRIFIDIVSHDLKNPIFSIYGFSTLLLKKYQEKLGKKGEMYLQQIRDSASRMEQLVSDLLELSRVGKLVPKMKRVPSRQILADVVAGLQNRLAENSVKLVVPANLPSIHCDAKRIYQVFENLLLNSLKFTSNTESPRIEIGYLDRGEFHCFYVRDNGLGIDPKHHGEIFKMFRRLEHTKDKEGTGLGLTIVERIVDKHGGKVWLESEKGRGATFYFSLPKVPVLT